VIYQTAYGQNTTFVLPDSSVVTLNGNTRLTHHETWDNNKIREVWLDGEAFFEVKNNDRTRFVVHTPGMDVEVLGTKFNVFNRDDKVNVVLNSGKVKVKVSSDRDTSSLLMMPNEAVEFYRKDNTLTKRQVKAEVLTSWRNKILVFENTPLYKIKEMIEYNYGVEVIFTENVDATEALAGTIPSDNLEVLLKVLAKSSNLNISRKNNQIIIDKKDPASNNPKPK
jgi:ferric-dicitrate binding protein FerR (iron transport regulator)